MQRTKQEIYKDIATTLSMLKPDNAQKLIAHVELSPANDSGEFKYDYVDKDQHSHWIEDKVYCSEKLFDLLIELKKIEYTKMYWQSCKINVDVKTLDINLDFKYE